MEDYEMTLDEKFKPILEHYSSLIDDIMHMYCKEYNGILLKFYKHWQSRDYIVLDDNGNTYKIIDDNNAKVISRKQAIKNLLT